MLLIDSDILIDAARKDAQALAFIAATAISHAIPLASKNQKHFRPVRGLELLPWPTIATP